METNYKDRLRQAPGPVIMVCVNWRPDKSMCCSGRGSEAMADLIEARVKAQGMRVSVERSVCMGHCVRGMNVRLVGGPIFHHFKETDMEALFEAALKMDAPGKRSPPAP